MLNKVLNGRYTAVVISAILHLIILAALIYFSHTEKTFPAIKATKPAIKSYIYRPSKAKPIPEKIAPEINKAQVTDITDTTKIETKTEKKSESIASTNTSIKKATATKPKIAPEVLQQLLAEAPPQEQQVTEPVPEPVPDKVLEQAQRQNPAPELPPRPALPETTRPNKPRLSATEQLTRLRSAINSKAANQLYKEHTQARSASAMDGEQIPVPHSVKQLTRDEKYQQSTMRTGHHAITKNDNGTCTIHREQMLGSSVEATTSHFSCGESKFDKNFREHMKKVNAKIKPIR
ncbi:hypothetical protein [Colwellia asteriadis]|uniref:hypothetical protein n=1 Tax=Colwellia asteriadis TaxID=517723 RepID=UPI0031D7182A